MKSFLRIVVCLGIIGFAFSQNSCQDKIKAFRSCIENSHKNPAADSKRAQLKTKIEACFSSNGCKLPTPGQRPPSQPHGSGNQQGSQCFQEIRKQRQTQMETCIKSAITNFAFPQKDNHGNKPQEQHDFHGGHGFGGNDRALDDACGTSGNKAALRTCIGQAMNASRPTDAEQRQAFDAKCNAKKQCEQQLGAECKAEIEKVRKAMCQCGQSAKTDMASIPACASLSTSHGAAGGAGAGRGFGGQGQHEQKSCDAAPEDVCAKGYDAWKQAMEQKRGSSKSGGHWSGRGGQ